MKEQRMRPLNQSTHTKKDLVIPNNHRWAGSVHPALFFDRVQLEFRYMSIGTFHRPMTLKSMKEP